MDNTKILWKEGMFLQPQHFQQAERYLLNNIHSRITAFQPYHFGITDVEIDRDALSNELLTLNRCTGILPDGTTFSIPREDTGPQSRSFSDHFSMEQQTLDIYLALPLIQDGRGNVSGIGPESHQVCRYSSKTLGISDEVFGTRRKEIEVGGFCFYILFGDESLDNYSTVQIGKLKRTPSGQISLQEDYIPPLLQVGASRYLQGILRSMLEMLVAKSSSLSQGRRQVEGGFAEFAATEETAFRLLQTINTYTPLLNYHHFSPLSHPFDLYSLLTMFAGALSTFSTEVSIKSFPQYDHQNLTFTFGTIVKLIRSVLEADISAGCVAVPIEQINQATFVCKVPDERLFSNAKFFLGISARVPEKELIVGALQRIKMCSRDRLDLLISSAMPGLQLLHNSRPPEGLSTKPGFVYFALDQQSQFWRGMQSSISMAFYFPNNYPELKLEMLALKE